MSFWAIDPELFLHKGRDGVVRVRRCKSETTSTSSMLMKLEDLKDEGQVTDCNTLRGGYAVWEEKMYKALIDYIYTKHLMVNHRGSVIAELTTDDKAAPVVYIRALDILAMDSYGVPDQTVPARTVKYLQSGTVVPTDTTNSKEKKLLEDLEQKTKEAAALQQDLTEVENKNKVLGEKVAELEQDLTKVENKNKVLGEKVAGLEEDLTKVENKNKVLEEKVAELEEAIKNCGAKPPSTFRIYTAADTGYSLTILGGHVILGPNDEFDNNQYWIKDDKYGSTVKDAGGLPCYALVNAFTGEAMKPPSAAMKDVQLVPYNPNNLDRSILWSEHEQGDGYRAIRSATHTSLNLDGVHGDKASREVRDETTIKVGNWLGANNQRWNMVPYDSSVVKKKMEPLLS